MSWAAYLVSLASGQCVLPLAEQTRAALVLRAAMWASHRPAFCQRLLSWVPPHAGDNTTENELCVGGGGADSPAANKRGY